MEQLLEMVNTLAERVDVHVVVSWLRSHKSLLVKTTTLLLLDNQR